MTEKRDTQPPSYEDGKLRDDRIEKMQDPDFDDKALKRLVRRVVEQKAENKKGRE